MDKKRLEELYYRALDGGLSEENERELADHLQAHPECLEDLEGFGEIRKDLQAHFPATEEPPYPEFFNSHLERMIREDERGADPAPVTRRTHATWLGWLLPAAGAVALAFFAGMQLADPGEPAGAQMSTSLPVVYSPITSVRPEAVLDQETGNTVILLEGLAAIPDSVNLAQASWDRDGQGKLAAAGDNF